MYDQLHDAAIALGFELVGATEATEPSTFAAFRRWIDAEMHAGMNYLADKIEVRSHPKFVLENVRSVLMLGVSYEKVLADGPLRLPLKGIARYARGIDYHDWIRPRLKELSKRHRELAPNGRCRGVVDTAPILERQFAVDAGLGIIGKNTMLLNEKFGSTFFLAALLSTEPLQKTTCSAEWAPCDNCRRCLDACPTGAIVEPFVLDARRCLNYWTIEHRGEISSEIIDKRGDRFFGCDHCQNACPWNRPDTMQGTVDPRNLDSKTLAETIRGTPMERMFRS